jgi:hypothetical protein
MLPQAENFTGIASMGHFKMAWLGGFLAATLAMVGSASATPAVAGHPAPVVEDMFGSVLSIGTGPAEGSGPVVGDRAPEVIGCINFGRFPSRQVFRSTLRANSVYRLRVVPDRRGFNVVMTIDFGTGARRLFRVVNSRGPGGTETFTINTARSGGPVNGTIAITGVRGSFGCFNLTVTRL